MAKGGTGTKMTGGSGPKARGMTTDSSTKEPQAVDRHVGSRVRMQRLLSGMSQEKLGEACGITFQQIQKYEKGMNRMGASRLHQIARILQVPVEFFYEGVPSGRDSGKPLADTSSRSMTDFLGTSDGLELVRAFMAVKDAKVRRRIVDLTKAAAAQE
jgi:transcriptional regulator with XRE-family HTH domain